MGIASKCVELTPYCQMHVVSTAAGLARITKLGMRGRDVIDAPARPEVQAVLSPFAAEAAEIERQRQEGKWGSRRVQRQGRQRRRGKGQKEQGEEEGG
jgi:hypothetical protein